MRVTGALLCPYHGFTIIFCMQVLCERQKAYNPFCAHKTQMLTPKPDLAMEQRNYSKSVGGDINYRTILKCRRDAEWTWIGSLIKLQCLKYVINTDQFLFFERYKKIRFPSGTMFGHSLTLKLFDESERRTKSLNLAGSLACRFSTHTTAITQAYGDKN